MEASIKLTQSNGKVVYLCDHHDEMHGVSDLAEFFGATVERCEEDHDCHACEKKKEVKRGAGVCPKCMSLASIGDNSIENVWCSNKDCELYHDFGGRQCLDG